MQIPGGKILIMLVLIIRSVCVYANDGSSDKILNAKEESIVVISAFTANGDLVNLNKALHEGLNAGLTISEIREVLIQLYAYAGFPRSLNALNTLMAVLAERKETGVIDVEGKAPDPIPANQGRLAFGTAIQTQLVGAAVKGAVYEFAPTIDQFLKEHLFGDIFGRNNLDFKTREIATISALASLGGAENQLRSHFNVGIHNGLTREQLQLLVTIISNRVGFQEGYNASIVLQSINSDKSKEGTNPDNFAGNMGVYVIVKPDSILNTQVGSVTFEPGARTNWHYHSSGQILVITHGTAYYQEKRKPKRVLSKGQSVTCLPGVAHWHGAGPGGTMTHLAISPNMQQGNVVWLQRVTDEEYKN